MTQLSLPTTELRDYQKPLFDDIVNGNKEVIIANCHRRSGKTTSICAGLSVKAFLKPMYCVLLAPTLRLARRIYVDNIMSGTGQPIYKSIFPDELVKSWNSQEMKLTVKTQCGNESVIAFAGSDVPDAITGTNPEFVGLDEFAVNRYPEIFNVTVYPIIKENGGQCVIYSTPRGYNHFYRQIQASHNSDKWSYHFWPCDYTWGKGGTINPDDIRADIEAGVLDEQKAMQEFFCTFSDKGSDEVFAPELIEECMQRRSDTQLILSPFCSVGVDPARLGPDLSVIATRIGYDWKRIPIKTWRKTDVVQLAQYVDDHCREYNVHALCVDAVGVGGGVGDMCRRTYRLPARDINFGGKASLPKIFKNKRTELICRLAEIMKRPDCVLPDSERLRQELHTVRYKERDDSILEITPKSEMKEALGRSSDEFDAVLLSLAANEPAGFKSNGVGGVGSSTRQTEADYDG